MLTIMKLAEKCQRLRRGQSLRDIATAVSCSPENIRSILSGESEPKLQLGMRLADHLGVPLDWLADDAADWPPPASQDERIIDTVRAAMATAVDLPADERELLRSYRALDRQRRDRALGLVIGMAAYGSEEDAKVLADALEATTPPDARQGEKRKTGS